MKELGLQELLRYALSGGVGIASLLLMYPNAWQIGHLEDAGEVTLILGAVLVLGTSVYNIHRALLFPPFFRAIGLITISTDSRRRRFIEFCQCWWWWRPSKDEIAVDCWRWKCHKTERSRLDEWAAQTHFLYCAAWAILAAFLFGYGLAWPPNCRVRHILEFVFCASLASGMVDHYRLLYYINARKTARDAQNETIPRIKSNAE